MLGIYGGQGGSVLLRGAVLALHAGLCLRGNRGLGVALRGPPRPPPSQGRPKAAQRQSGHAAAPNASGGTEGEPNGRNFRPPGVAFLEGCAVLHGPLLRGGCFARRSQATSCGACCRYASQAWALGAGPTGPMGERERERERERENESWYARGSCAEGDIAWGERASGYTGGGASTHTRLWDHSSACRVL